MSGDRSDVELQIIVACLYTLQVLAIFTLLYFSVSAIRYIRSQRKLDKMTVITFLFLALQLAFTIVYHFASKATWGQTGHLQDYLRGGIYLS